MNYDSVFALPIIGGIAAYFYKRLNNKVDRSECIRVHEQLDKRLQDIQDDVRFIKEEITKR
jgi:hypothetical protein